MARRVLQLVFALSSGSGALTRPRLERRLGVSPSQLSEAFEELAALGLLDVQRLRLTLSGLAVAVACGARLAQPRAGARRKAADAPLVQAPIALFSRREAARAVA